MSSCSNNHIFLKRGGIDLNMPIEGSMPMFDYAWVTHSHMLTNPYKCI